MRSTQITLGSIVVDALFTSRDIGHLQLYCWGPLLRTENATRVERKIGHIMGKIVNKPYRDAGKGGNYFFWHQINSLMDDMYACEDPERRERFIQYEKGIRAM